MSSCFLENMWDLDGTKDGTKELWLHPYSLNGTYQGSANDFMEADLDFVCVYNVQHALRWVC